MIQQHSIDEIFSRVNVVEVIQDFLELKRAGSNYKALSPFTKENTPSFSVSPVKNIWKCFSSGKGGNAIKFLMEHKQMSYPEALEYLAEKYHVSLDYSSDYNPEEEKKKQEEKASYEKIMQAAALRYHKHFLKLPEDHPAKIEIFENRKLDDEDVAQWKIGYAPGGSFLRDTMREKGLLQEGMTLGLLHPEKNVDRYFDRIIYPIMDHVGNVIGLAGRRLGEDSKYPKFINPIETPLYNKSKVLYGLNFALDANKTLDKVYVTEGYNDVIACHKYQETRTVASCGTSLTEDQLKLLYRFTKTIVLLFDNDHKVDAETGVVSNPGQKRALELVDLCLKIGFEVEIVQLPLNEDPDSFPRSVLWGEAFKHHKMNYKLLLEMGSFDAIPHKAAEMLGTAGNHVTARAEAIEELAELISLVDSPHAREIYVDYLNDKLDVKKQLFKKSMDAHLKKRERGKPGHQFGFIEDGRASDYEFPRACVKEGLQWTDVKNDILKYQLFFWNNKMYSRRGTDEKYSFAQVSNFQIQIIQHIEDEKQPMKLVQLENMFGRKRTFDTRSDDFVTELSFKKMVTGKGNFNWKGQSIDFERLMTKLMDEMGDGRMVAQLGWQPEGFWAFNNAVVIDNQVHELDNNGCFNFKKTSYYIPSGNSIYANNPYKYQPQKRVIHMNPNFTFKDFLFQMRKVHREHSFNAMLFTMATAFSDVIYQRVSFFPLLFLYGEASTGKDNLIECCQSLFGVPQEAITITGKANTDKAKIREFAQFTNMMVHMTEYQNGDDHTDQMMKSLWDRRGYKRGTIDSHVGTESVPILSTCVFTGNHYPTADALITRFIAEEMNKDSFTQEEKDEYEVLKEMVQEGVSHFLVEVLKYRSLFSADFRKQFKAVSAELKSDMASLGLADRMIANASVLGATFKVLENFIAFPFTFQEWKEYMFDAMQKQSNKRMTGSAVSHWWDTFLASVKEERNGLRLHREFDVAGEKLFINFKQVYLRYNVMHYNLFREKGLASSIIQDKLKKSEAFIEQKATHRYGEARTSAYVFNLDKMHIKDDLLSIMEYSKPKERGTDSLEDAQKKLKEREESSKKEEEEDDMPF